LSGQGIDDLVKAIETRLGLRRVVLDLIVDPADGAGMSWLYRHTEVMEKSLGDNGKMAITVRVDPTRTETVKAKFPMH
jgi:GTP-binding protein HflX